MLQDLSWHLLPAARAVSCACLPAAPAHLPACARHRMHPPATRLSLLVACLPSAQVGAVALPGATADVAQPQAPMRSAVPPPIPIATHRAAAAAQAMPTAPRTCAEPMQLAALLASQLQGMSCHPASTAAPCNVLPASPTADTA